MTPMRTLLFHLDTYLSATDQFHVARKSLDAHPPSHLHYHDYFELFLVEKGVTDHWINGGIETLGRGSLVFIRPNDAHAFRSSDSDPGRIFNIMFRLGTASHLQSRYGVELGQRFFWKSGADPESFRLEGPRLERAINAMDELMHAPRTLACIEQFLLFMMTRVVDYSVTAPEGVPNWLANACVAARSPDVFRSGVAGFVRAAGRGHEHVSRETRRHLGMSPTEYLTRVRMEHAALLLSSSDQSIEEVAMNCGIENLSHFYKRFRNAYGTTPRRYRLRHRLDPVQPQAS